MDGDDSRVERAAEEGKKNKKRETSRNECVSQKDGEKQKNKKATFDITRPFHFISFYVALFFLVCVCVYEYKRKIRTGTSFTLRCHFACPDSSALHIESGDPFKRQKTQLRFR